MAKKVEAGGFVSPANLWGKPLPATLHKTVEEKKGASRMRTEDDDNLDLDVDGELESDGPSDADLLADEEPENTVSDADEEVDDGAVVTSTVESDVFEPASVEETTPAPNKRVVSPMAEKKSISDHVRDEIAARRASGDSLRGVDIVNALAKKKIKVSAPQVSQLLKKAGVGQKARGKRAAPAAEQAEKSRTAEKFSRHGVEAATPAKRKAGDASELPIGQLRAAKTFVDACGGSYATAQSVLSMHAELGEIF